MRSVLLVAALVLGSVAPVRAADEIPTFDSEGSALPQTVYKSEPRYPRRLQVEGVQGRVDLVAVIEKDGSVSRPVVLVSNADEFTEAAKAAVVKWKYRPARLQGEPVAVYFMVSMKFNLNGSGPVRWASACDEKRWTTRFDAPPRLETAWLLVAPEDFPDRPESVTVDIDVCRDGSVAGVVPRDVDDPRLRELVESNIRTWHFRPATRNGARVAVHHVLEVPIRTFDDLAPSPTPPFPLWSPP